MKFKKFTKEQRSSFPYWFYHWLAFNYVAIKLHMWKFKYLLHDIEKPWLRLFWPYEKVQKWHRTHNSHHLEYKGHYDLEAMAIDWECSRLTKIAAPMTARETLDVEIVKHPKLEGRLLPMLKIINEHNFDKVNL